MKKLLEIEKNVMEASMSDTAALGEAMIALIDVLRDYEVEIIKLNAQLARVHEAAPLTAPRRKNADAEMLAWK